MKKELIEKILKIQDLLKLYDLSPDKVSRHIEKDFTEKDKNVFNSFLSELEEIVYKSI